MSRSTFFVHQTLPRSIINSSTDFKVPALVFFSPRVNSKGLRQPAVASSSISRRAHISSKGSSRRPKRVLTLNEFFRNPSCDISCFAWIILPSFPICVTITITRLSYPITTNSVCTSSMTAANCLVCTGKGKGPACEAIVCANPPFAGNVIG